MNKTFYSVMTRAFGKKAWREFRPGKPVLAMVLLLGALVTGGRGTAQADPVLGPNPPVPPAYSATISTTGGEITPADLFHPFGIAMDRIGNLYVSDRLNDRVLMRDTGNTWSVLSNGTGTALGRFTHVGVTGGPAGIAVDLAGNVYVADWGNHRVQKCDTSGNWTAWGAQPWGTPGAGLGQFNNPTGIAIDSAGNLYVADTTNNRIQKRDTSGTWTEWSDYNWVPGGFNGPKGVAVDSAGTVYVADQSNQRIHQRTADGTWSFISSTVTGTAPGYFNNPTQITVDSAGNVYVSDTYNYRIQRRDGNGTWSTWGSQGNNNGQFDTPEGVAVDPAGNVYVSDTMNNRIEVFSQQNGNIYKSIDNNQVLHFSLADFTGVFTPTAPGAYSLVSVRIDSLPLHGTLRLGAAAVTPAQVIPAASLDTLAYVPDPTYGGTDRIVWNASDQVAFSPAAASIGITVLSSTADTTPDPFAFTAQTGVARNTVVTSDSMTVTGIEAAAPVSISGTGTSLQYSINGGTFTASPGTVNNGDTVRVRQTASASFNTATTALLNIGGVIGTFSVTTQASDTTPDSFSFTPQTGVALNTVIVSNTVTVTGINTAAPISISGTGTGCQYSLNSTAYTASPGTVSLGDTVTVRQTSSGNFGTITGATLNIGGVTGTFNVTTLAADTTPNAFSFSAQTGVALNTLVTSNSITVSGINTGVPISITGGQYSINNGTYTSVTGTVSSGNTVRVQQTSSGTYSTTTGAVLTIGGVSGTFNVTTLFATTTLISAPAVTFNANGTVTVTVSSSSGTPSGTVSLSVDNGTAVNQPLVSGATTFTISSPAVGSHALNAAYAGQGNFAPSAASGTLTVRKANQTIAFSVLSARNYGDGTFALTATASSGLPVAFTSSNPAVASVSGNIVTIVSAGTATITASQDGNASFNEAIDVARTLTVNRIALTVTANNASRTYGAANPAFTAGYSGFVNNDTISAVTGTPALSTTATAASAVGTYAITAAAGTLAAANYSFSFVPGTLTVSRAALTVTANNTTRAYGAANPVFTPSYSGFMNGDTSSVLTGAPALSTTATTTSAVGSYAITAAAGTLGSANYTFSFTAGTLTVTQANQTITFNPLTPKNYGNGDFSLSASASSGLTVTFTSSNTAVATVTGNTVHLVSAGTATITAAQSGDGNYLAATSVSRPQAVNKVVLTVTANNAGRAYNTDNPAFTAAYSGFVNNETQAVIGGNPALSTAALMTSPTGTYAIVAAPGSLSAANYDFSFVNGTLTIVKANQTINLGAFPATKNYGEADFGLYDQASSGLAVTYTSSNTAVATIVNGNVHIVGAGTATISANQAGNTNYNAAAPGTHGLTVNKIMLTVAPNNASRAYGVPNPAFTAYYSGFVNADTAAVLTGVPSLTTTATITSPRGSYPILAAQGTLASANYTFTYVAGVLTIDMAAQTITFGALPAKTYGNADFSPGATASSGLDISYSSSNTSVAAIVGTTIHITGAGTTTITANQTGDSNYGAATPVNRVLTVNKAGLTVTANNGSRVYGVANPVFTAAFSGFVNGESATVLSGVPSLTTAALLTSPVGTYTITAAAGTLAAANYVFTWVSGALTVTIAPQTITFNALPAQTYGNGNFAPNASASSNLAVAYASSNTAVATIVNNAVHLVSAGTATITASQAGDSNNSPATPVARLLTVNKATLTVTGSDANRAYGSPNPAFSATPAGFVNNETAANLGGTLVLSTTADATSPAGSYAITPAGYTSSNYTIVYVNGTLTINAILPSVSTAVMADTTIISASSGGSILSDGGSPVTMRGVCWSRSMYPTVADACSQDGMGNSSFTSSLGGLTPGALYHVRAYATTAAGTAYGSNISGTTLLAGDLNSDGLVDITDALRSLRIAAGIESPTGPEFAHGDVGPLAQGRPQPDAMIDLADVVVILRMAVGHILWQ